MSNVRLEIYPIHDVFVELVQCLAIYHWCTENLVYTSHYFNPAFGFERSCFRGFSGASNLHAPHMSQKMTSRNPQTRDLLYATLDYSFSILIL